MTLLQSWVKVKDGFPHFWTPELARSELHVQVCLEIVESKIVTVVLMTGKSSAIAEYIQSALRFQQPITCFCVEQVVEKEGLIDLKAQGLDA